MNAFKLMCGLIGTIALSLFAGAATILMLKILMTIIQEMR